MNDYAILCTNVVKTYFDAGVSIDVLRDVNFKLSLGEKISIVGRSGSGKTTLLQLLGTLDTPTTGQVKIFDNDIATVKNIDIFRNENLGFVYQFHHLLPEFSALENVAMPLLIANKLTISEIKDRAMQMLISVGLEDRASHMPSQLSGGERQRTAIARAMVTMPKIILADEPTGNLDNDTGDQVFELFEKLQEKNKCSIIVVTHDLLLANRFDKTYHLRDGQLVIA